MAVSAYILIQTEVGKAATVAEQVRAVDGVASADDVTGPYDVIAQRRVRHGRRPRPHGGQQGADDRRDHAHAHLSRREHLTAAAAALVQLAASRSSRADSWPRSASGTRSPKRL